MKLKTKFQDEDFELGEVTDADIATMPDGRIKLQAKAKVGGLHTIFYDKLEKLYSEWEDAPEEPKSYWFINTACYEPIVHTYGEPYEMQIETGNHFETREECERAYEKLKAWKFGGKE